MAKGFRCAFHRFGGSNSGKGSLAGGSGTPPNGNGGIPSTHTGSSGSLRRGGASGPVLAETQARLIGDTQITCPIPLMSELAMEMLRDSGENSHTGSSRVGLNTDSSTERDDDPLAALMGPNERREASRYTKVVVALHSSSSGGSLYQEPLLSAVVSIYIPEETIAITPSTTYFGGLSGATVYLGDATLPWAWPESVSAIGGRSRNTHPFAYCRAFHAKSGVSRTYRVRRISYRQFHCIGLEAFAEGKIDVTVESAGGQQSRAVTLYVEPPIVSPASYVVLGGVSGTSGTPGVQIKDPATIPSQGVPPITRVPPGTIDNSAPRAFVKAEWPVARIVTPANNDGMYLLFIFLHVVLRI